MRSCIVLTGVLNYRKHGKETIPERKKMGIRITQYTGREFMTTMPEGPNQNPHQTILPAASSRWRHWTGWGFIWLLLQETPRTAI